MRKRRWKAFHTSSLSPLPQQILSRCSRSREGGGLFTRYRHISPMYWKRVQSHSTTPSQKRLVEKRCQRTTDPPATSGAPVATTPPMLWYIGKQLYIRSLGRVSIIPANQ